MIAHPAWTQAELHQMRVMRDRLRRRNGHVILTRPPNRAEQHAIAEWERERRKPEKPPGLVHWRFGAASKVYVGLLAGIALLTLIMGLGGGLPEATAEQQRPFYERHLEPIFGKTPWKRVQEADQVEARRLQYARDRAAGVPLEPLAVPPVEPATSPTR